jgi:hypothetical protein
LRLLCGAVIAASVLAVIGCRNDGDAGSAGPSTAATTPQAGDSEARALLQEALDATLAASAYHMTFSATTVGGGEVSTFSGEGRWQSPDNLHLATEAGDNTVEFLSIPPDVYLKQDGVWYVIPPDADPELRGLAEGQSIQEFVDLINNLEDAAIVGSETIGGITHQQVRGTFDLRAYIESLPEGRADEQALAGARMSQPATFEIWVSETTKLIGRVSMDIRFLIQGQDVHITFDANFDGYNDASSFPERPVDAPAFQSQ